MDDDEVMERPRRRQRREEKEYKDSADDMAFHLDLLDGLYQEPLDPDLRSKSSLRIESKEAKRSKSAVEKHSRVVCAMRRLGSSEADEPGVVLTLTNIDRVWQAQLGLAEFKAHKAKLGMPDLPFEKLFGCIKTAFQDNLLSMDLSQRDKAGGGHVVLGLSYKMSAEIELMGMFQLREVTDKEKRLAALEEIMFALLPAKVNESAAPAGPSNEVTQLQRENKNLQFRVSMLEAQISDLQRSAASSSAAGSSSAHGSLPGDEAMGGAGSLSAAAEAAKKKAQLAKLKKKDRSILNPRMKKRKQRGIVLGEGEGSGGEAED